jgi:integrase
MQDVIDSCDKSQSSKSSIKNLFNHLDKFAFELDIINKMYSQIVVIPPPPETERIPFTEEEIDKLWEIQDEPWVDTVLIFLYTGFRFTELTEMKTEQVDLDNMILKGGVKTAAGKNRIVPIHPRIQPFFINIIKTFNSGYVINDPITGAHTIHTQYYKQWNKVMEKINTSHTPHEARHTFRSRLDSAGGNKVCIDMLMGHKSLSVGERIYTHKTIEELRDTIRLLK